MASGAVAERPVLVVTQLDDVTADLVIDELHSARGVPVVRLDSGDFPAAVTLAARFDSDGLRGALSTQTRHLGLDGVRSVYWRRPSPYAVADLPERDARWCIDQARFGLGGVLAALPGAHYVNHPWRNRDAEYKPAQLATAARCGLQLPPTLITNDTEQARRFAAEFGPVIYKPLWNGHYVGEDARALTVWVDEVTPAELDDGVRRTAHLFQQCVDKAADVRLTAVGRELFAVRIDGAPGLDWRRDYDALTYTLIDVPPDVTKGVRAYLDAFGLVYGAFDFGLRHDGSFTLYECNPNGQFAWFPSEITDRITTAIADQLQHAGEDDDR